MDATNESTMTASRRVSLQPIARPRMPSRRALVILQEIFGLNAHIGADATLLRGTAISPSPRRSSTRRSEASVLGYDAEAIEKECRLGAAVRRAKVQ
jgi:hypothetical protein